MSRRPVSNVAVKPPASRFDTAVEVLMVVLLAFMPLAFGAVDAWSEMVVAGLAGAMLLCLVTKHVLRPGDGWVWTWAYLPLGLFLLLGLLQLVPLPASWVGLISPATVAERTRLLGDLPGADQVLKTMTISFYPAATERGLRLVLVVTAVFFVVVNVYRRPEQIKRLLAAIAVIGALIALLAVAQVLSGTGSIYWLVPTAYKVADAGSFVNHSNYAQFANLALGAALALLLVKLREGFRGEAVTLAGVFEHLANPRSRSIWLLVGAMALGAAAIVLSLSRGGAISLLIAAAFTALIIASRRGVDRKGWVLFFAALGAFLCVLYVGFDAVYERLATLRELHNYEGRWQIVKDIAVAWTRFPLAGTGLGTHEVVYPMFDRSTIPAMAAHAENEYAQLAEETGLLGLGLLVGFLGLIWAGYARALGRGIPPICSAAFGLGFGLLAVMIHSLSDFGQHLPANIGLSAVFCGLLVSLARQRRSGSGPEPAGGPRPGFRWSAVVVLLAIGVVWIGVLLGGNATRKAEAHWEEASRIEARLSKSEWLAGNDEYAALIAAAQAAAECEPNNVQYRHWLNVFRWRSISRVKDAETGGVVMTPQALEFVSRIASELHAARPLCPTYGPLYCVAGQMELFVLNRPIGADHIRMALTLAPADPTVCFVAGLLDVHEGRVDASLEKFRRALALGSGSFEEIVQTYIGQADRPDLAVAAAGDDVYRLLRVATLLGQKPEQQSLAGQARAQAISLLEAQCQGPGAPATALASLAGIYRQDRNYQAAIECYRRALNLDYGQVSWRLDLARSLAEVGEVAQAIQEARVCLRLRPQMEAARRLIAELSVRSEVPVRDP